MWLCNYLILNSSSNKGFPEVLYNPDVFDVSLLKQRVVLIEYKLHQNNGLK
jgi:hypothetical protein